MRISFGLKLGVVITGLTVGITTVSLAYLYTVTADLVSRQVRGRLVDVGSVSTFLFDAETRQNMAQLKAEIDQKAQFSIEDVQQLKPGGTMNSLSPEDIRAFQAREEFQALVQILRQIHYASLNQITPLKDYYPQRFLDYPDAILTYLVISTPESPDHEFLKFLASFAPEPEENEWDEWGGNPIGNLYVPVSDMFRLALETGEIQFTQDYESDSFYTSMTAAVPIQDAENQTIAVLGLDYQVRSANDGITYFRDQAIGIILISFLLSVILSALITQYLKYPVEQLEIAARQVLHKKYNLVLDVDRQDEMGSLVDVFNMMVADIRDHTATLERKVLERTLELQQANKALQKLAEQDGLTGVFNRRYFDQFLEEEWLRSQANQTWISLIFCDIDCFKPYNDTYGHQAGDQCLREVAQTVSQCVSRSTDVVARYGGEEFVVVLPETPVEDAVALAEQIRCGVNQRHLANQGSIVSAYVTVSLGVASMIPTETVTTTALIKAADQALYQAKNEGRDRIAIGSPPNQPAS